MLQKPATKQPLTKVPGHTHLFRRGATYYFRVGVPKGLRKAIGKTEIIKSLRTTDFAKAKRLVTLESANANARLESEREKLQRVAKSRVSLASLSDVEVQRLAMEWFIGLEKDSEEWFATEGSSLDSEEVAEVIDNLRVELAVFSGRSKDYRADDGSDHLNRFLAERGLDAVLGSPVYHKLREAFRRARLENARRQLDRFEGQTFEASDPLWKDVFAHTTPPKSALSSIKLGEFLDRFLKFIKENRSETTFTTYQTSVRIMEELFGRSMPLGAITKEDIERLGESLKNMPTNAHQRYPSLTNEQAIIEAAKRGDTQKLGAKTLENYFRNILAVFNFAVEEKYLKENPASFRSLREQFRCKKKVKKAKFNSEELVSIFRAPIFTGCIDDEAGFAKPGRNKPRRGRFWVPLLSLFQGLRCNEACQLYVQDVKEAEGVPYLAVRTDLDDNESIDKRLKNVASTSTR